MVLTGAKCILKIEVNKYALLTKRCVKMAGHWPSSFFACSWAKTVSGDKTCRRTRPISGHFDWSSLVNKGFVMWKRTPNLLRDTSGDSDSDSQYLRLHVPL